MPSNDPRSTERYGLGQSGYTAGRVADDPSLRGETRNASYPKTTDENALDRGDERFTGRGGGRWAESREPSSAGFVEPEQLPLGGYAALLGIFTAGVATFTLLARDRLPKRIAARDFALLAIATHKLSRIVAKDEVTSPLRAPFVRYQQSGTGKPEEKPRGRGLRRAVGKLVTCRWCTGQWIAAALGAGFVVAPRATRFVATIFGVAAVSDVLQFGYDAAKRMSK